MNAPAAPANTLPTVHVAKAGALEMTDDQWVTVLTNSLYPGAQRESVLMVLNWCRASGKDPMKRPVHIVPMTVTVKDKDAKGNVVERQEKRDVIMPGIGDYRTDAARTGCYAGIDKAVFGPPMPGKWNDVSVEYPEWCEVVVWRIVAGVRCSFTSGQVRWKETYATKGYQSACPNAMWQKRPYGQLEKCAEAMALRRAFPEIGAQPTAEEMHGRTIDAETLEEAAIPTVTQPEAPRRASEKPAIEATVIAPTPNPATEPEKVKMPASDGAIGMLSRKIEAAGLTAAQLMLGLGKPETTPINELTLDEVNAGLKWVNTGAGK